MANANTARGLLPYRHTDGSVWNGSANMYYVSASYGVSLFIGDPVAIVSSQNDANGVPAVQIATAGAANLWCGSVVGIVAGGQPQIAITRDQPIYHPASTAQYILVADDPLLLFEIQEDSVGGAVANTGAGRNANLVSGTGSTTTGYSGWMLQSSSVATGNGTYQLKIQRLLDQADNVLGTNAKWLVKNNQFALGSGSVGS